MGSCQPHTASASAASDPVSIAADIISDCDDPIATIRNVAFVLHTLADSSALKEDAQAALHEMTFHIDGAVKQLQDKVTAAWELLIPLHKVLEVHGPGEKRAA